MKISPNIASQTPDVSNAPSPKLINAAHQFESMLLQEMLKPMRSGQDSWGGDGESDNTDHSMDTVSSFGTEAVATAISKGGGLGIARQIIQQVTLEHQREVEKTPRGTNV